MSVTVFLLFLSCADVTLTQMLACQSQGDYVQAGAASPGSQRSWQLFSVVPETPSRVAQAPTPKSEVLLSQAKENFVSALVQLNDVGQSLARKVTAHETLTANLPESPPAGLMNGLNLELAILSQLIQTNNAIGAAITIANGLANGNSLNTSFGEISQQLTSLDQSLKHIQDTLREHRSTRQAFKLRLVETVDSLILAKGGDTNMLKVKVELDPRRLDEDLQQQRNIILSAAMPVNMLK